MRRLAVPAVMIALAAALPSWGNHQEDPARLIADARIELASLDRLARGVPQPGLRAEIDDRIDRIELLLVRAEGSLVPPEPRGLRFDEALSIVERETFDRDKLAVIQSLARTGRYTTAQARQLAATCSFDSTRADALVALYPSLVDPERFALALDVLDFSSTRRDVQQRLGL